MSRAGVPIVYFHIPKTGGISVAHSVADVIGPRAAVRVPNRVANMRPEDLSSSVSTILSTRRVAFVHGHLSPASFEGTTPIRRIVTLREPGARLLSHFCFSYENRFIAPIWHRFFLRISKSPHPLFGADDVIAFARQFSYDNIITRYLTGKLEGTVDFADADKAVHHLRQMDLIGFVEDFEPFFRDLGVMLIGRPLEPSSRNHSNHSVLSIGPDERATLSEMLTSVDQMVYQSAKEIGQKFQIGAQISSPLIGVGSIQPSGRLSKLGRIAIIKFHSIAWEGILWVPLLWAHSALATRVGSIRKLFELRKGDIEKTGT